MAKGPRAMGARIRTGLLLLSMWPRATGFPAPANLIFGYTTHHVSSAEGREKGSSQYLYSSTSTVPRRIRGVAPPSHGGDGERPTQYWYTSSSEALPRPKKVGCWGQPISTHSLQPPSRRSQNGIQESTLLRILAVKDLHVHHTFLSKRMCWDDIPTLLY